MYQEVKSLDYGKKSRKVMWLIKDENNELTRETNNAKEEWTKQKYEAIVELERKGKYD